MNINKHTVRTRSLTVITEVKNEVLEDTQKTLRFMRAKSKFNWKQLAIEILRLAITLLIGDNVIN